MAKNSVLVADDEREVAESVKIILETSGYSVTAVFDGKSALKKALEIKPDLILLDHDMPLMTGNEVCRALKKDRNTRYIPVILMSGVRTGVYDRILGLKAGAEDYFTKPFDPDELKARIESSIRRTKEIMGLHPMTKLPGSIGIEEEITGRINSGGELAVAYVDLDHFKAYNDSYGYKKGDDVIKLLHDIIFEAVSLKGSGNDFIGHIGGDDFITVTVPGKVEDICGYITENFDRRIPAYYLDRDRQQGCIVTADRQGNEIKFPLMTVSIGISTNEKKKIGHYAEVIDILIEMKKYAKSIEEKNASVYVKDRRSSKAKVFEGKEKKHP